MSLNKLAAPYRRLREEKTLSKTLATNQSQSHEQSQRFAHPHKVMLGLYIGAFPS
ncbi:hypothetical protein [Bifidobacterium panos]|nr:hypothetical protein [Bifidobacterium sp. DSM 109963]